MAISLNKQIPPCQNACPVKTRARDYVRTVGMGKLEEAYSIITENNPFPSACGRVCMHPCEQSCRRKDVDEPISIASLKRYAADYVNKNALFLDTPQVSKTDRKIAIVGAGPSGLAAAVKLANSGHQVDVYEKNKKAGGMLRYGIPCYRLPDADMDEDIKRIKAKGVKIFTGKAIGKDVLLDDLKRDYDAVLVAVGLSNSRSLPIEGADAAGIHLAIPFLAACTTSSKPKIGNSILIIGGGNVAIDVARSARRLKPKAQVTMICLENAEEMPASIWEREEAIEENITIKNCMGPRRVETEDGKAKGMHFITCAAVFDALGRFNPTFKEAEKHYLEADTIIIAIGQQADLSFLPENLINRGRLVFDNEVLAVTEDGLFACGEVAKGPGAAISAIAHGNMAAKAIEQYMASQPIDLDEEEEQIVPPIPAWLAASRIVKKKRQKNEHVEAADRINFNEFDKGLDRRSATKEALRCMDCGSGAYVDEDKCVACLTCVRVCPFWVAKIDPGKGIAHMPEESCQACGACAAECPANAIDLSSFSLGDMLKEIEQAFENKKPKAVGFVCQTGKDLDFGGAHIIRVKCPIRIEDSAFLKPFELGAKKVFVVCHKDESCRYIEGPKYLRRRVGYLKEILDNIGVGAENIGLFRKSQKEEIINFVKEKADSQELIADC